MGLGGVWILGIFVFLFFGFCFALLHLASYAFAVVSNLVDVPPAVSSDCSESFIIPCATCPGENADKWHGERKDLSDGPGPW